MKKKRILFGVTLFCTIGLCMSCGDDEDEENLSPQTEDKAYLSCPDSLHPHVIDLNLPSGTKWCCCNVGASTPEGYGGYYAWGGDG